jgi:arylsulfatase A-like enzyme
MLTASFAGTMLRAGLIAVVCLAGLACSRSGCKHRRPNVVILSIDTLRSDSLRAYDPTARPHPAIDRLAQNGHVFGRAYSTASWTLPSHASIFTGLYPDRHGGVDGRYAIGDVSSFVQTLRTNGYQTVGFTDGGYLSADFGFARGFENYDDWSDPQSPVSSETLPREGKPYFDAKAKLFDRAIAFLRGRKDQRPLFLFVHTYAVHDYFRRWLPRGSEQKAQATPESKKREKCLTGRSSCSKEEWRLLEADYEAEIEALDRALAPFLALVKETLGNDNTFILLLSDHGEGFDHTTNRIHHGGRLHRDQLQVPLFVTGPGIERGRSEEAVSLADVRASVVELAGLKEEEKNDGRSFAGVALGRAPPTPRDAVWAQEFFYYWKAGKRRKTGTRQTEPLAAARIGSRYWYIQASSEEELYDVADKQQSRLLSESLGQLPKPTLRQVEVDWKPPKVDNEEVIEQLRALGYIE